jgi:serine/threonine protein kinase
MDYIPFPNLGEYLVSNRVAISLTTKVYLMFMLVQALRCLKDYGVVHLDLKPSNILIYCNLYIKLIDFGESYHPDICKQGTNNPI